MNSHEYIDRRDKTPLNACSLEVLQSFHDQTPKNSHPLVIGCYQLNENSSKCDIDESETTSSSTRSGALLLHMIPKYDSTNNLKFGDPVQILHTSSGILDGKWFQSSPLAYNDSSHNNDQISSAFMYAAACASGTIDVYQLKCLHGDDKEQMDKNYELSLLSSSSCGDEHGLALALAWDESSKNTSSTRMVSSYSNGTVAVHDINLSLTTNDDSISETHRWNAHTLFGCASEVWTTCFATNKHYSTHDNIVISGGDDCKMKLWDLRTDCSKPINTIGDREYGAGVTTVSYHPFLENVFASGSYDESVRIWDMRKLSSGESQIPMASVNVGGGVWRIKWHPTNKGRILVGAMHGGCRVIDAPQLVTNNSHDDDQKVSIIKEFTEHESMAYGADWLHTAGRYEAAASCSFYDRQTFIWDASM